MRDPRVTFRHFSTWVLTVCTGPCNPYSSLFDKRGCWAKSGNPKRRPAINRLRRTRSPSEVMNRALTMSPPRVRLWQNPVRAAVTEHRGIQNSMWARTVSLAIGPGGGGSNLLRCVPFSEVATTPATELDFLAACRAIQRFFIGHPEFQVAGKRPPTSQNHHDSEAVLGCWGGALPECRTAPVACHVSKSYQTASQLLASLAKNRHSCLHQLRITQPDELDDGQW
jgi:hypothetical protein